MAAAGTSQGASSDIKRPRQRAAQTYLLLWVDGSIDKKSKDCQKTLAQLRSVVNDVSIYNQPDQCIKFLNEVHDEKVFVITSGSLGQHLVPKIHAMPQLDAIYIFCGNKSHHAGWAKNWTKIKGVHTAIEEICQALEMAVKQYNQDSVAITFTTANEKTSSQHLNQLEPSYMYTQIFKDILLEMEHDHEQAIKDLATYCRELYASNLSELKKIDEFEKKYDSKLAIWWYTRDCFIYKLLNRALRILDANTIIKMGFFIRDLHQQIHDLHQQQVSSYREKPFLIYRGQGLSTTEFEKLANTTGGLMSFNNFLSTHTEREVSLRFAESSSTNPDTVGILFVISVDPRISLTPFAATKDYSYFPEEGEILFSMHTVFRVGTISKVDNNNRLYQVELHLTADNDEELRILTKQIVKEVGSGSGWQRLGKLLLKMGQLDEAEQLYNVLLCQTTDGDDDRAQYYHCLGCVKKEQGDYKMAMSYYEKALDIQQKTLPSNHPNLATSYSNLGQVYDNMGEYSKALSYGEKALDIQQRTLPPNHPDLPTSYNSIGNVYNNMREYPKALSFHEKALDIRQKALPANHPDLGSSFNSIGSVYNNMGEYSKALSYFDRALQLFQRALPQNHPQIKTVTANIDIAKKKL